MSKSLGNYFTLRDLLAKGFTGREVRYLLLTAHYRESFNFTLEGLQGARAALARIDECLGKLREIAGNARPNTQAYGRHLLEDFKQAMDDDLNVAKAWGGIFDWIRDNNRVLTPGGHQISPEDAAGLLSAWAEIDTVLAIGAKSETEVPAEILALAEARAAAKKAKDFKRSDAIRDELKAKGWAIEDTPKGPRLKRL
jgi:cysteinyl-tRNA synthetase